MSSPVVPRLISLWIPEEYPVTMAAQQTIEFPGTASWRFARRKMPQDNIEFIPQTSKEGNNITTLQIGTERERERQYCCKRVHELMKEDTNGGVRVTSAESVRFFPHSRV